MKIKIFDIVEAEGTEAELAIYTHLVLETFRLKAEFDKKQEVKKEMDIMDMLGRMTFGDIMKQERDEEE